MKYYGHSKATRLGYRTLRGVAMKNILLVLRMTRVFEYGALTWYVSPTRSAVTVEVDKCNFIGKGRQDLEWAYQFRLLC